MDIDIKQAIEILKSGNVIGISTDTVYGFAVLEEYKDSVYSIKKRDKNKPLINMIDNYNKLDNIDEILKRKMKEVWPGNTTLIFDYNDKMDSFRIPNDKNVINLISKLGCSICTTSANLSGDDPVLTREDFYNKFPKVGLLKEEFLVNKSNIPSSIFIYENGMFKKIR